VVMSRNKGIVVGKAEIVEDGENYVISRSTSDKEGRIVMGHCVENDVFCDVFLFCDSPDPFRCHRVVLASMSDYFEDVFVQTCALSFAIACPSVVVVANVRYDIMRSLIEYFYTGTVQVMSKDWPEFMSAVEVLKIRGLSATTGNERSDWTAAAASQRGSSDLCATDFLDTSLFMAVTNDLQKESMMKGELAGLFMIIFMLSESAWG
jgi:hypothetical protein